MTIGMLTILLPMFFEHVQFHFFLFCYYGLHCFLQAKYKLIINKMFKIHMSTYVFGWSGLTHKDEE